MRVKFHGRSDPGRKRPINEDAFAASDEGAYCVLCDGMGGHSSGEVASRMAVDFLGDCLQGLPATGSPERCLGDERARLKAALPLLMQEWLRAANLAIYRRGTAEPGAAIGRSMGTTLALLCVVDDMAFIAHIGDSRVYRMRDERLEPLTRDHSVTAPVTDSSEKNGRSRKFVTRALGTKPEVLPDLLNVDVRPGDCFLLCSDGLTDLVRDQEILQALKDRKDEMANVPRALVNLANERGGRDNITVVVAVVEADEDSTEAVHLPAPPPLEPPPPWESSDLEEMV